MNPYFPDGRIERAAGGKSYFVFSDLEKIDPQGQYKVAITHWRLGGVSVTVRVDDIYKSLRFNRQSFQDCFSTQLNNEETVNGEVLRESVFRAKMDLLKMRAKVNRGPNFDHLVGLLYEGPERKISYPSKSALEALGKYSSTERKVLRLSADRFGLRDNYTILGNLTAIGEGLRLNRRSCDVDVKISKLQDGRRISLRFDRELRAQFVDTLNRFRSTPYIMPTFASGGYENEEGKTVFVSCHPLADHELEYFLRSDHRPSTQIEIAHQILTAMKAINKEGIHRNIRMDNIFIRQEGKIFQVLVAGLKSFVPHGALDEPIKLSYAPELKTDHPPPPNEKEDVWLLGVIFLYLFRKETEYARNFSRCYEYVFREYSQEKIDACIQEQELPSPIFSMIQGMLQRDPENRWSMSQVLDHFQKNVIDTLRHKARADSSLSLLPKTYAKVFGQTVRILKGSECVSRYIVFYHNQFCTRTQVYLCYQILLEEEAIHEKGVSGYPNLRNRYVTINETSFSSYNVWELGLIFHALFRHEVLMKPFLLGCTQDDIQREIDAGKFLPPVAEMLLGMLQVDTTDRWTLSQVGKHFREKILVVLKH